MTGGRRGDAAEEARDLVRQAAGNVVGLTVKGQIKRAIVNLGYAADGWRVREAWYGRAYGWSAAVLHDLRLRLAAWREREAARAAADGAAGLAERVAAVRRLVAELAREVEGLEEEVGQVLDGRRG